MTVETLTISPFDEFYKMMNGLVTEAVEDPAEKKEILQLLGKLKDFNKGGISQEDLASVSNSKLAKQLLAALTPRSRGQMGLTAASCGVSILAASLIPTPISPLCLVACLVAPSSLTALIVLYLIKRNNPAAAKELSKRVKAFLRRKMPFRKARL